MAESEEEILTPTDIVNENPAKQEEQGSSDQGQQVPILTQIGIFPGAIKQRHLVSSPTQPGDMYYGKDGNSFENLSIGEDGQFLTVVNGSPAWQTYTPSISQVVTGTILMWPTGSAPSGYLLCDGSAVSRTTYATLFALIGTTYGTGNGSTTFNVPNLKGKVPVGYNSSETEFDALGETGGEKTHTLTTPEIPSHTHSYTAPTGTTNTDLGLGTADATTTSATTGATGGGGAHNNLQPYITLNFIIKT